MEPIAAQCSIWLDAPLTKTWETVTDAQSLSQWYAPGSTWEIATLEVGQPIRFLHKSGSALDGTIEMVDAPHRFQVRWFAREPFLLTDSVTRFTLVEENHRTRVMIQVYETPDASLSDAERQAGRIQAEAGFAMSLENLKAQLEGQPVPHVM